MDDPVNHPGRLHPTRPATVAALLVAAAALLGASDPGTTGHSLGPPDAPVVVTEFSDFGCPYCSVFSRTVFPALRRDYIETGRVRWLHVPFVLGPFPNSARALSAAECAADAGAYWGFHAILFRRQVEWKDGDPDAKVFPGYAGEAGVDEGEFRACLADGPRDEVRRGNEMALVAAVAMTPTFFIDGRRLEGAVSLEAFRGILDEALERAAGEPPGEPPGDEAR